MTVPPGRTHAVPNMAPDSSGAQVEPAIVADDLVKLYGDVTALNGLSFTVAPGTVLDRFGLTEAANRVVRTYSGGMQRKLDVAMGLVHRPTVLFLDEPTTGLDPQARAEMWAEISRLATHERLTILLTTHYLEEADHLADRLAIVDRGSLVAQGGPDQLKSELRGDAVVTELAPDADVAAARSAIERLGGIREITLEGQVVRARVDHGASAVPAVLAALETAGVTASSITVARPSLDDVYLRHTGRTFAAAELGGSR